MLPSKIIRQILRENRRISGVVKVLTDTAEESRRIFWRYSKNPSVINNTSFSSLAENVRKITIENINTPRKIPRETAAEIIRKYSVKFLSTSLKTIKITANRIKSQSIKSRKLLRQSLICHHLCFPISVICAKTGEFIPENRPKALEKTTLRT